MSIPLSILYASDPIGSRNVGNNIKYLFNIINSERYLTTHHSYPIVSNTTLEFYQLSE